MKKMILSFSALIINQSYRIMHPVTEVLNLPPDDEVEICLEIAGSNYLDS